MSTQVPDFPSLSKVARPFGFPRSGVASEELLAMDHAPPPGLRGARPRRRQP